MGKKRDPDDIQHWDDKGNRWRKSVRINGKERWITISPKKLGGTNQYDTEAAWRRYEKQETERLKFEHHAQIIRENEAEYLEQLDSYTTSIPALLATKDKMLLPLVEKMKQNVAEIKRRLALTVVPPFEEHLRNPLNVSLSDAIPRIEKESVQDIIDENFKEELKALLKKEFDEFRKEVTKNKDDFPPFMFEEGSNEPVRFETLFNSDNLVDSLYDEPKEKAAVFVENPSKIRSLSEKLLDMIKEKVEQKKEETGAIEDYERGRIHQRLEDNGLVLQTPSKLLGTHIDSYIAYTKRREKIKKITPDSAQKIITCIEYYQNWSGITNVERIADKQHIDAYYDFVSDNVFVKNDGDPGKISDHYGRACFNNFKTFLRWLLDEGVITSHPICLGRRDNRYSIPIITKKVKKVSIADVHKILEKAPLRLQLCIYLTLNCGLGTGEIGRLKKDEFDPVSGRITRKRIKTKNQVNVPEVSYKLWDKTKELLLQQIEDQKSYPKRKGFEDFLLLNRNGKPLWNTKIEDKFQKADNIVSQFKKFVKELEDKKVLGQHVNYYMLRKLPSSLLYNHKEYKHLHQLWLGHAPSSVAEKNYIDVAPKTLDDGIEFIYHQIFSVQGENMMVELVNQDYKEKE